jgi:hypothetical protein
MLGYDPLAMFGSGGDQPIAGPQANAAAVAQPSLDQLYQEDLSRAQMGRVGNLGMMLLAASGQLTPAQRATILAQAPQYMDGAERDAMTASQARLFNMRSRAEQDEMSRADQLRKQAPTLAAELGLSDQARSALTPEEIRKMYIDRQQANTPEAQRRARLEEAQIQHYLRPPAPEAPTVVELQDGRKAIIQRGSTTPIPLEPAQSTGSVPPGVDPQKWRETQTKAAADQQAKSLEAEKILPNVVRARQAYEAGQGYIGPVQSSSPYRAMQGILGREAETKRSDIDNKLAAYQKQLVMQSLPPGAASDKDIAEARRGMASIGDTSTVAGLASIDADISRTIGMMGYNVPPAHISELIKDIRSQNREGVRQFIEAHKDGDRIVGLIGGSL